MDDIRWYVAHTRPRREKKLAEFAGQKGVSVTLPCFETVHKYRGKVVRFQKPLFPGYVFLRMPPSLRQTVLQSDHVANLLDVVDQELLQQQLEDILAAIEAKVELFLAPEIGEGMRVKIKSGPMRGMEGWVEQRYGMTTVLLRLDFISQAAAMKVEAGMLELI